MKIKITFLLLFINTLIFGQLAGVYKPLKFKDIDSNWIHVSFDSTIVGQFMQIQEAILNLMGIVTY